jgi:DNA polymerase I-like protein with 3'-5' exonuclease and polymerase domains
MNTETSPFNNLVRIYLKNISDEKFRNEYPETGIILAPYDELVIQIPEKGAEEIGKEIADIMANATIKFIEQRIEVEYKILKTWIK